MCKTIAHWLLPNDDKLSKQAAAGIRKGVNGVSSEKQAIVAKYATLGNELSLMAANLSEFLKDGRIDELEEEQLAELIKPLITKSREVVGV